MAATRRTGPGRRSRTKDRQGKVTTWWPDSDVKGQGDHSLGLVIGGSQTSGSNSHGDIQAEKAPAERDGGHLQTRPLCQGEGELSAAQSCLHSFLPKPSPGRLR